MALNATTFDIEALVKAWLYAWPGLTGPGGALTSVFLTEPRPGSQAKGAWCVIRQAPGGTVDDSGFGHTARVGFDVKAKGGEEGAKHQASQACLALARACRAMNGSGEMLVTAKDGTVARLVWCANVVGPSPAGEPNGIATYRLDSDFTFMAV